MSDYLCIAATFLDPRFHGRGDGGEPEWPPSPLRLVQAIIAAHADDIGNDGDLDRALTWRELQEPPLILLADIPTSLDTWCHRRCPESGGRSCTQRSGTCGARHGPGSTRRGSAPCERPAATSASQGQGSTSGRRRMRPMVMRAWSTRSRARTTHGSARTPDIVETVLHLRRPYHLGPIRIVWYLERYHGITISKAGVYRILRRHGRCPVAC